MANIWLAAGEGKLDAVKQFIEQDNVSPNALDDNHYSPLHAAASWNHPEILSYLVEKGGDINITDDDGETPLFVVETVGMARMVVELGGNPSHRNEEGMTAAQQLQEEYPHIAVYLRTISGESSTTATTDENATEGDPNLDAPTDELMAAVRTIMEASQRGELSEAETDEKLREVVEQIVGNQVEAGRAIGDSMEDNESTETRERPQDDDETTDESKRPRENIGR
ncbi:ankyrin repeat domain-containing protein [Sporobolomyces salmoneus]|uniref:ankyrin repeat domain-containing protein n=1 Tax=Sporobolomyces salmoneus TaxID=183962 RepID=UPI00317D0522